MGLKTMTAKEVTQKVINKEPLFILDVRNEQAYNDWKIEGESLEYLNVPYFDLLDGVDEIIDQIPRDQDVLVTCAKEGSSKMVGEMLVKENINVAYLEGGMKSWSEHLEPVKLGELVSGGELYQFVRVGKGCLSYVILSDGEAAIVDPTRFTDVYLEFIKEKGAKVKHVLDTHLHADHISGGKQISEETGATYWLPPKDAEEVVFEYEPLEDGEIITIGSTNIEINALHTPGHTIGSTSFIVDQSYLLTGDTLFIDSIGRPDLAGKADDWVADLRETLYTRYRDLSNELIVLPGHFMIVEELNDDGSVAKSLKKLFAENHGLNIKSDEQFKKVVTENLPPQPNAFQEVRQTNMGKLTPELDLQVEMEIGPNRCAVR